MTTTTVRSGNRPRRALAGLLVRLADRLAPRQELVRLTVDGTAFRDGMADAAERLHRVRL